MPKSKKLFLCLTAFILGVFLNGFLFLNPLICLIIIFICFSLYLLTREIILLIIFFLFFGLWRLAIINEPLPANHIYYANENKTEFIAIITEIDERLDHTKLTINTQTPWQGKVLVKTPLYPIYEYGTKIKISCFLKTPNKIDDFDYGQYLARYNVYSVCYSPKIEVLELNQGNLIMKWILQFKNHTQQTINKTITEPHAAFLSGLLIGARKGIPNNLMESFNRNGVTHIIAISGYNITIIATMFMNICLGFNINRKKAFKFMVLGITIFTIFVGMSAAVVRSAIMGIIVLLAKQIGRPAKINNVLALTAFVMLLHNPLILKFDVGFQLSFLATIGLIYLSEKIKPYFEFVPKFFSLQENLVSTLSATILTAPLIIYQFGRISLIAPITNILILPAIPLAMLLGFIQVILGMFWIPIGTTFGYLTYTVLQYIITIVNFLAQFEFSSINL